MIVNKRSEQQFDMDFSEAPDSESNRWSEAIRPLLIAVALTPMLFLAGAATVVTPVVTLSAVAGGLLCGGILATVSHPVSLEKYDEITVAVVSLGAVFAVTMVVWVIVPPTDIPALIQFSVAFLWGSAIVEVSRHLIVGGD